MNESDLRTFRDPVRHSDLRRANRRRAVLPSGRRQPRAAVPARAAQGAGRLRADAHGPASSRCRRRSTTLFEEFYKGTEGRKASTTMVFVRILSKLLRDKEIGELDRADRAGRGAHVRHGSRSSAPSASTRTSASSTSRSTWTRSCTTRKRRTGRSSKRASPKPGRCRRSSPPAPRTRRTASTRFRSSSTTRCSASSASAT